jgi:hypothetical protein
LGACEDGENELPDELAEVAAVTFAAKFEDALKPSDVVTTSCKLCWPVVVWIAENCSGKVPLGSKEPIVCICCGVPSRKSCAWPDCVGIGDGFETWAINWGICPAGGEFGSAGPNPVTASCAVGAGA